MTKLDQSFFDEYKQLDKLLCDCYMTDAGVTPYIEEMTNNDTEGRARVSSWQRDLRELKHLRYLRNKLAHETEGGLAEQKDIDSVKEFQVRITNGDDPLARLHNERNKDKKEKPKKKTTTKRASANIAPAPVQIEKDDSKIPILFRVIIAELTVLGAAFIISAIILFLMSI